ncbi:MAG: (d)CMP kinase, partial [Christensenellaceae bacterium]|nr:(d)CMP kinase [Christensenellaceae bacterium]
MFVDASAETRAMRRFKELVDKGSQVSYEDV